MSDPSPPPPPAETSPPPPPPASSGSPTDFLKGVVGKRVVVRLTSGVDYRGTRLFLSTIVSSCGSQVSFRVWTDT